MTGPVELRILGVVHRRPGVYVAQLCRILNNRDLRACLSCSDYLNPRRKKRQRHKDPECTPRLGTVKKAVSRLRARGTIRGVRSRVTDKRMARGWDLMVRLYPADYPYVPRHHRFPDAQRVLCDYNLGGRS